MLMVESRLRKTGKDVMLHVLSYCSWSWFEVSPAAGQAVLVLENDAGDEEDGSPAAARVKRRKARPLVFPLIFF